jgi:hypothetical protein
VEAARLAGELLERLPGEAVEKFLSAPTNEGEADMASSRGMDKMIEVFAVLELFATSMMRQAERQTDQLAIATPQIIMQVPQQPPPSVTVVVPEQPAPVVNVKVPTAPPAQVTVNVPQQAPKSRSMSPSSRRLSSTWTWRRSRTWRSSGTAKARRSASRRSTNNKEDQRWPTD